MHGRWFGKKPFLSSFPVYISACMHAHIMSGQEAFVHKVTKMIEHRKEESQEILKGWFTPEQMKTELHWGSTLRWN